MRSLFIPPMIFIIWATTSAGAATSVDSRRPKGLTILSCVSGGAEGSMVKTLELEKNVGSGFTAKMESAFEDGVVTIDIPTATKTASSTQYVLMHDHDLLMTLATYEKQAVVFYQSTYDCDQNVNIEFLLCK